MEPIVFIILNHSWQAKGVFKRTRIDVFQKMGSVSLLEKFCFTSSIVAASPPEDWGNSLKMANSSLEREVAKVALAVGSRGPHNCLQRKPFANPLFCRKGSVFFSSGAGFFLQLSCQPFVLHPKNALRLVNPTKSPFRWGFTGFALYENDKANKQRICDHHPLGPLRISNTYHKSYKFTTAMWSKRFFLTPAESYYHVAFEKGPF